MNKLNEICPDFPEWPDRWMGIEADLAYGEKLLKEIRPFAEFLAESSLTKKTQKKHLTNLWILGGEIIRDVNINDEYFIPASEKLMNSLGTDGGPYCRHLHSEAEMNSYDSTCRKLFKFMLKKNSK